MPIELLINLSETLLLSVSITHAPTYNFNFAGRLLVSERQMLSAIDMVKYKSINREGILTLTPRQMFQTFLALAQVKAGNRSESLLNEMREIIQSLYQAKVITKKVYNNIMNSIKL